MRLGLRGQVRQVLAPRGVKVVQRVQLVYQWVYLLLAVEPRTGQVRWRWVQRMNAEHLLPVLQEWGLRCVVWDGAPAHRARVMQELETVRIRQPAYSPELNPAERIFEEVRRWTEGEVYDTLEAKQIAAEVYLHHLDRNPDLVRQLCGWDWITASRQMLPPASQAPRD
jgi:transposase